MFPYQDSSLSPEKRAADLLARMTLEEKIAQTDITRGVEYATKPSSVHHCCVESDTDYDWKKMEETFGNRGIGCLHDNYSTPNVMNKLQRWFLQHSRLGIPVLFTGEALHGVSGLRGTIFPCPIGAGATFDPELIREEGAAIGREARSLGIHEVLAPNLDVAREPRWGRVEETFGEDTYLSSGMAVAIVKGHQKDDISRPDAVISEPKHFCVHGIAEGGINCAPARAGKREVNSCYLPVFEAAIKEGGAKNVMVSYNCVDGDLMLTSKEYLQDILKGRLQLSGCCRADWGGVERIRYAHHMAETDRDAIRMAVGSGLDLTGCCDMSCEFWENTLAELVRSGELPESRIDDACFRMLKLKFEAGLFEHPYTDEQAWESIIRCDAHRAIALRMARESAVLLKNDGVLPLDISGGKSIALIGPSSAAQKLGGYSSIPVDIKIPSLYDELKKALPDVKIRQCNGCAITEGRGARVVDGQPHLESAGEEEILDELEEALQIAASCDLIIMVGGDNTVTSGEGMDRCELTMHGRQRELAEKLSKLGKPLVLVTENGKPLELSVESDCCNAILMAWFGGERGAEAIADVLLGKYNPAGRLPVSLPRSSTRLPCYYSKLPGGMGSYLEGAADALYPFGHGLSYTKFDYSPLTITQEGQYDFTVSLDVTNSGDRAGEEVVQLYLTDAVSTVVTPDLLLKGFQRIALEAGETKVLHFRLNWDSFKLMNAAYEWVVEPGKFIVQIGASSRDLRQKGEIVIAVS